MTDTPQSTDASPTPSDLLTPGAAHIIAVVTRQMGEHDSAEPGVYHWLTALLERHGAMAESLTEGIVAGDLRAHLLEQIAQKNCGNLLPSATLLACALARAQHRQSAKISERDLTAIVLQLAGYTLTAENDAFFVPAAALGSPTPPVDTPAAGTDAAPVTCPPLPARVTRPTPTLEKLGWDLTRAARDGKLPPVVARDVELELVIETLCRRTKRNPVLVGPAGVGKTAIVEGLAHKIVRGDVPDLLKDARLISLSAASITAGCSMVGQLEERMKQLIAEASQASILLFIDEVHTVIGAGGNQAGGDVANMLKPALARGDIACIAATTDDEYRRYIEQDTALERRFQPVRVQELSAEQTFPVLQTLRDDFFRLRQVEVSDDQLHSMIAIAEQFLRHRHFPDKAVDLLEQCVAAVMAQQRHAVTNADVVRVSERLIGMPAALEERFSLLRDQLLQQELLTLEDREALLSRLAVTMRGLDLRAERPNVVLLLVGACATRSVALADTLARTLFGAKERCVTIDFSTLLRPEDITQLLGAPPGYVGFGGKLPLHDIAQMPWCVVHFENLHVCHPLFIEILTEALATGYFTEARGKRIYLSDTVVLLTADVNPQATHTLGFLADDVPAARVITEGLTRIFGPALLTQVDRIFTAVPPKHGTPQEWVKEQLLQRLTDKYRKHGVAIKFDDTFLAWLGEQATRVTHDHEWERLIDEQVSPTLVPYLRERQTEDQPVVTLSATNCMVCAALNS